MDGAAFQLNKMKRFIRTHGKPLTFERQGKNEFGEPNGKTGSFTVIGVFHEVLKPLSGWVATNSIESTTYQTKHSPMILALWEDVKGLQPTEVLTYNGKTYKVNAVKNILESNLIGDITLEEVQTDGQKGNPLGYDGAHQWTNGSS